MHIILAYVVMIYNIIAYCTHYSGTFFFALPYLYNLSKWYMQWGLIIWTTEQSSIIRVYQEQFIFFTSPSYWFRLFFIFQNG